MRLYGWKWSYREAGLPDTIHTTDVSDDMPLPVIDQAAGEVLGPTKFDEPHGADATFAWFRTFGEARKAAIQHLRGDIDDLRARACRIRKLRIGDLTPAGADDA